MIRRSRPNVIPAQFRIWSAAAGFGALLLAGCDIPTAAPIIDSQWVVPIRADSVTVVELLPDGVTNDGVGFQIRGEAAGQDQTLRQLCPSCPAGLAPKPAFEGTVTARTALPTDVVRATLLAGGHIDFSVRHDLGFDPLRPSPTARGRITITIRSGAAVIATSVIDGTETALPAGTMYQRILPIPGGAVIENDVAIEVRIVSPAGGITRLDPNQRVTVSALPVAIRASSAAVRVESQPVSPMVTEVDLAGVSDDVRSRVRGATLRLRVANPLAVGGAFSIRFLNRGAPLIPARSAQLTGGDATIDIDLSQAEIDVILAADRVQVEVGGSVSGSAADRLVTVTPRDVVRITPRIILEARIGE